jgi:hypothetical protein
MPAWGSMLQTATGYVGQGAGYAAKGFKTGAGYMGGSYTAMSAATGAVGGGIYGATAGRDYGQSHLGGAFTGALGGAALGAGGYRYGGAGLRGGRRTSKAYARIAQRAGFRGEAPRSLRAQAYGIGAGRGAFRQAKRDALTAYNYIGKTLSGNGAFNGLGSTLKAGYNKRA